ncbi:3-deoxy-manno-octulosonate cytidylyltransferase [Candidatus Fukatsuia anoeciicola]|uniref:3-deoxy-manno-octulosonate cytidylyltransferase n=1 Tax=Candidatus Fukatsuia anoeciicola TaxID=2994492 RepID=UPI003463D7CF
MSFIVIIPARYKSRRLLGKPLADINGKAMVLHVMERALQSGAKRVIIATDNNAVVKVVKAAGGEACLTRLDHQNGTERLVEVIKRYRFPANKIIVNVQGDEPLIPPVIIRQVVSNLATCGAGITTLAAPIKNSHDIFNPNVVKVVRDMKNYALYFSRAPIPWNHQHFFKSKINTHKNFLRHIGIYAYHAAFIQRYINWPSSPIEKVESLEQLRILWHGEKIHVELAQEIPSGGGVDIPEDLQRVRNIFFNKYYKK